MDIELYSNKISKELFFDIPNNVLLLFLNYLKKCKQEKSPPKMNIFAPPPPHLKVYYKDFLKKYFKHRLI